MSKLQTALLIDGSPNPVAIMVDPRDRQEFINQGRAANTPRNFKFVKLIGDIPVYRLADEQGRFKAEVSDEAFESIAASEADKFMNPQRYATAGIKGALNNAERDELERLRALVKEK